jgi:hypothetical protein
MSADWDSLSTEQEQLRGSDEHHNEPSEFIDQLSDLQHYFDVVAGSCKHGNEPLDSIKGREFFDLLCDC